MCTHDYYAFYYYIMVYESGINIIFQGNAQRPNEAEG